MKGRTIVGLMVMVLFSFTIQAQQTSDEKRFSLVFGLNQPVILRGFNFEGNYWMKKWVIDYSHGFNLHADGKFVAEEYERQKVNFRITHSLGVGIGYRFTRSFNLRFEPKWHMYETYYEGQSNNSIVNFSTYTLGLGAYYRWMPFEKKEGFAKGITIVPSVRYWHKVGSSLDRDQFSYSNTLTNQNEVLKAPNIGASNTPWIINISVGYTF